MVALDIDGTLLYTGTTVPLVTSDAVTAVSMAGHHIVVATGRSLVGALPVARSLGLDNTWIVASNGAVTARLASAESGEYAVHEQRTFDVDPVVHLARTRIPGVRIGVEEVGWGWRVNEEFASGRLNGRQRVVNHYDELWATPVTRLVLAGPDVGSLLEPLRELGVTATPGGAGWVDVTPRGLSKASALEVIRVRLEVPADRTVAIGDGWNDAEMFTWAAHAIAMGHAPDPIKELAAQVTGTIHEHGAAAALHSLIDGATLLHHPTLA
jgi:hydroxymethylpyrimidine pyrophosphatase-like HAD family hydrolase